MVGWAWLTCLLALPELLAKAALKTAVVGGGGGNALRGRGVVGYRFLGWMMRRRGGGSRRGCTGRCAQWGGRSALQALWYTALPLFMEGGLLCAD